MKESLVVVPGSTGCFVPLGVLAGMEGCLGIALVLSGLISFVRPQCCCLYAYKGCLFAYEGCGGSVSYWGKSSMRSALWNVEFLRFFEGM